ncbi:ABC transporter ATP-binding protein [Fulvivirga sp. M361]|uniref:ABC transporter ATP-binding protein n=1 Tax=Fulvivirga sp. M361 TaxID=2594266 RepID=UPI00117AD686|nr:ABC transporter ATP-binding protein [Fulvivirga sp. M361]TRX54298.1 ABC transporter ATP-binding protein [Fulvivirga sp. M361]
MFRIELHQLGKRFNKEVIFKGLDYEFESGRSYALTGPNGSGKSTLLQIISGFTLPTDGKVKYSYNEREVEAENVFKHLAIATPYMELIEAFTLYELLDFHFKFRVPREGYSIDTVMETAYLSNARNKYVKNFSSGMKQRVKLALAFYSQSEIVLLDEPTTNLDRQGMDWYQEQLLTLGPCLTIIASNQQAEYEKCSNVLSISDYK